MIGLFLSCICEATGALLCYLLSAVIGPPLLTIEAYRTRLETWRTKIMGDKDKGEDVGWDGVFSFLVVLRIAPFPPHWIANFVAPHLGINPLLFWSAVFIGIAPVSVIHTTIGSGLDSMTSAEDFHILSVRNVLGLIGIAVAVMIPSALKRFFKKDLSGLSEAEAALHNPDIQIQAASINGEAESTLTARTNGYQDSYYASDAITYQAQDSSTMPRSPTRYGSTTDSFYYGSARKGKGRAMDLEEALSVIENEEDHEVLAVVYEGDAEADSIIEEFASSALHQGSGSDRGSFDDDDKTEDGKEYGYDSVHSLDRASTHRGYGTIPHEDVEEEDSSITPRAEPADGKQWWSFWKS
ncbi:hypothetical protein QFC22_000020 [Naganishia vaughanmartiniae]|uniref:Uncharacterized protein n=1 Tax=Naganishia vaughanmartiniae TaxID=1424756 RepID=A0ACC2XP94_9TREE|nr:hypothetical protein QFC22_000020 [Naganishia vaughanmartiniae]